MIIQYAFALDLRNVPVEAVLPGTYCTRMLTRNRVDI